MTLFLPVLQTSDKPGMYKERETENSKAGAPSPRLLPTPPQRTAHQFSRMYTVIIVGKQRPASIVQCYKAVSQIKAMYLTASDGRSYLAVIFYGKAMKSNNCFI